MFSDASKEAIAAVANVQAIDPDGNAQISFVQGKSKLAPRHGHTIPRLEICAAVIATELGFSIQSCLGITDENTYYFTDSQVVLCYISNTTRRFYVYVANHVMKILKHSSASQWHYVPTVSKITAEHITCVKNKIILQVLADQEIETLTKRLRTAQNN